MNKLPLYLMIPAALAAAGCSSPEHGEFIIAAGPGEPMALPPVVAVPPIDVKGTWFARIEKNEVNCGMGESIDGQTIVIDQEEDVIDMLVSTGARFSGTVNGDIIEWAGNYDERGGTSNLSNATVVISADAGSGNADFSWSNGTDSCNGTMAIAFAKDLAVADSGSNSWPSIADPIAVENGVAYVHGSLGLDGDSDDFFVISLTEDGTLEVELSHFDTTTTDLDLTLLDAELNEVALSVSTDQFEVVEAALGAGDYYIQVEAMTIAGEQEYYLSVDLN
jgi:hypothetical protein